MFVFRERYRQEKLAEKARDSSIPIRTLYVNAVNNYPREQRLVYNTFIKYGRIHSVYLHSNEVFFFITFKESSTASRVLSSRNYFRKRYSYYIRPADQWHQPLELPDGTVIWNRTELDTEAQIEVNEQEKPSLMKLNNDCLMHIVENLALKELMVLERVNKRLRSLSLARWSRVTHLDFHTVFPWGSIMSLPAFRELLLRCGSSLTSLDLTHLAFRNLERSLLLIGKYCPNLKALEAARYAIKKDTLVSLQQLFRKLESLKFARCQVSDDVREMMFPDEGCALHDMSFGPKELTTNIRVLQVGSLRADLKDLFIQHPHLEHLLCAHLKVTSGEVGQNKLKKLTIIEQESHVQEFLVRVWPQLTELEYFSMVCDYDHENYWDESVPLPKLKSLKKLKELFMNHWTIDGESLIKLGSMLYGQLTKFSIHGCDNIDEQEIIRFLATQPNLEFLDLSQVDALTAFPIQELMNYVANRSEGKLLIVIFDEMIESSDPLLRFVVSAKECKQCRQMQLPFGDMALEFENDDIDMIQFLHPGFYGEFDFDSDLSLDCDETDYEDEDYDDIRYQNGEYGEDW